jgi:HlyD family secretion protein
MKLRWWTIGICGVGAIGVVAAVLVHRKSAVAATLPDDTYVQTVARGDLTRQVTAAGTVASNLDVDIRCRASGEVIELPFDIGDHVKKGQVLLKLDPADEIVALRQATVTMVEDRSKLEVARKTVEMGSLDLKIGTDKAAADAGAQQLKAENARRKADRQRQLLERKLASPEQYEQAESDAAQAEDDYQEAVVAQRELESQAVSLDVKREQVKQAEQQVQLDQVAVDNANLQLQYTTVVSPLDGVVSDLETQMGALISSSLSTVGGTPVMTVSDLSRIFVLASVDESDIGGVKLGQECHITADAFPRREFSGKVVRIAPQGLNTRNVVTFEVKIEVTDEDKALLRPEMTANVQIVAERRHDAVLAPMLSLSDGDDGQTRVTIVKDNNATEDRVVQVGIDDGDNAEILSGLAAGEKILVHHNDAESKWMGAQARSAGAAKKKAETKKQGSQAAKEDKPRQNAGNAADQKKAAQQQKAKKKNGQKDSDDSSDDDGQ